LDGTPFEKEGGCANAELRLSASGEREDGAGKKFKIFPTQGKKKFTGTAYLAKQGQ